MSCSGLSPSTSVSPLPASSEWSPSAFHTRLDATERSSSSVELSALLPMRTLRVSDGGAAASLPKNPLRRIDENGENDAVRSRRKSADGLAGRSRLRHGRSIPLEWCVLQFTWWLGKNHARF